MSRIGNLQTIYYVNSLEKSNLHKAYQNVTSLCDNIISRWFIICFTLLIKEMDKWKINIILTLNFRTLNENAMRVASRNLKKTFDKHNKAGTIVKQRKVVKTWHVLFKSLIQNSAAWPQYWMDDYTKWAGTLTLCILHCLLILGSLRNFGSSTHWRICRLYNPNIWINCQIDVVRNCSNLSTNDFLPVIWNLPSWIKARKSQVLHLTNWYVSKRNHKFKK